MELFYVSSSQLKYLKPVIKISYLLHDVRKSSSGKMTLKTMWGPTGVLTTSAHLKHALVTKIKEISLQDIREYIQQPLRQNSLS